MSDTPRTDACRDKLARRGWNAHKDEPVVHLVGVMEQLERELAEVTEQRDRLADAIKRHKEALHPCTSEKADTELWQTLAAVKGGTP